MHSPPPPPADRHRNVRVLIIEDEPLIAHTVEDFLIEAGFQIAGVVGKLEHALAFSGKAEVDAMADLSAAARKRQ